MEHTVDVGKNVLALIEKLATQIGTTVDQVFPWFVAQASIEGWMMIFVPIVSIVVFGILFYFLFNRANRTRDEGDSILAMLVGIVFAISVIVSFFSIPNGAMRVLNPNFYAMQELSNTVRNMK